jgi:hypothetical protein
VTFNHGVVGLEHHDGFPVLSVPDFQIVGNDSGWIVGSIIAVGTASHRRQVSATIMAISRRNFIGASPVRVSCSVKPYAPKQSRVQILWRHTVGPYPAIWAPSTQTNNTPPLNLTTPAPEPRNQPSHNKRRPPLFETSRPP